jgi:hypothetical protein
MSESEFDAFVARAWQDHADHAEAVAQRLRTEVPPPAKASHLAALARLTVHVLGEHLGRFGDARDLLSPLASHALADDTVRSALAAGQAALNLAEGRPETMGLLSVSERIRAESDAAAICVGRGGVPRALGLIASARARLAAWPDATPADHRPLAAACHNMAWVLHDRGDQRSAAETAAMLDIAAASREHWSHAGTWLEVERGDYDLAMTHLSAGLADDALRHAAQCLAECVANDAPPFELLFAHEALARAQHACGDSAARQRHVEAAQAAFDALSADDQAACRGTLDVLRALA